MEAERPLSVIMGMAGVHLFRESTDMLRMGSVISAEGC